MFRRLLTAVTRPLRAAAAYAREAVVAVVVYWVTRWPRRDGDEPPAPPAAP